MVQSSSSITHHPSSITHHPGGSGPSLWSPLIQEAQAPPHHPHTVKAFLQDSLALNFIRFRKPQACVEIGFKGAFTVATTLALALAEALLAAFAGMLAQGQGSRRGVSRPREQGLRLECTQHKHTMCVCAAVCAPKPKEHICPSGLLLASKGAILGQETPTSFFC